MERLRGGEDKGERGGGGVLLIKKPMVWWFGSTWLQGVLIKSQWFGGSARLGYRVSVF